MTYYQATLARFRRLFRSTSTVSLGSILSLLGVTLLAACGGDSTLGEGFSPPPGVVSVRLEPASATIMVGDTVHFEVVLTLEDGSETSGSLSFSATGGQITSNGLYTAGSVPGTFVVEAVAVDGTELRGTVVIQSGGGTPPPPPPPPPGGTDLTLDFNDGTDSCSLGVQLGSTVSCTTPRPSRQLPWRKHDYVPTGGVNGSGAINMHWFTGMSIGFSPVWITVPMTPHFKIRYAARQTATMQSAGSAQKMMRLRSGSGTPIGMLESKNGNFVWDWDNWDVTGTAPKVGGMGPTFNDGQWHIYEIEVDYRNISALTVSIWFDGVPRRTATFGGSAAGNLLNNGPLVISPITEMYSCGPKGCSSSINTGDYTVDDFSFTVLP